MMMINLYQTPPNMSSIGVVYDCLGRKFLLLLVGNLRATGRLRLNSSPVKANLIIFPLFPPEGNAILPITPKALCAERGLVIDRVKNYLFPRPMVSKLGKLFLFNPYWFYATVLSYFQPLSMLKR